MTIQELFNQTRVSLRPSLRPIRKKVEKYDWLTVEANDFRLDATNPPTVQSITVGATGNVLMWTARFAHDSANELKMYGLFTILDDIDPTHTARFHVLWKPYSNWSSGPFSFKLEWINKARSGGNPATGASSDLITYVTPTDYIFYLTEVESNILLAKGDILPFMISRNATLAGDTADGALDVVAVGLKYTAFRAGEELPPGEEVW